MGSVSFGRKFALQLATVFVVLALGIIEPLACILHCEFVHLLHQTKTSALVDANGNLVLFCDFKQQAENNGFHTSAPQSDDEIHSLTAPGKQPLVPLPQPFHELSVVLILMLSLLVLLKERIPIHARRLASLASPPPLPPPIHLKPVLF